MEALLTSVALCATLLVSAVLLYACGSDPSCENGRAACVFEHDFPTRAVPPGEETLRVVTWTLDNEDGFWVHAAQSTTTNGYHHATMLHVPDTLYDVPDGIHDPAELDYDEITAVVAGGLVLIKSDPQPVDTLEFAAGAAVFIPARSRIIGLVHLVNASDSDLQADFNMRLETIPESEVLAPLTPFRLHFADLSIPPLAKSEFEGSCEVRAAAEEVVGAFRSSIYVLTPHYHARGSYLDVFLTGGPNDGMQIFHDEGYVDAPAIQSFDEPFDLVALGATGLRFRCGYDNPLQQTLVFGNSVDDEMCYVFGFADSDIGWVGDVLTAEPAIQLPDGSFYSTGECMVTAIDWYDRPTF